MKKTNILKLLRENPLAIKEFVADDDDLLRPQAWLRYIFGGQSELFPQELLQCANLEKIWLAHHEDIGKITIPENIGQLKKIKEISIHGDYGVANKNLPVSFGKLKDLHSLSLTAKHLTALPENIGDLQALASLLIIVGEQFKGLPSSISRCQELRTLYWNQETKQKITQQVGNTCQFIWLLVNLEILRLPTKLSRLPVGITNLKKLENLSLSAPALLSIQNELAQLTTLETLTVSLDESDDCQPSMLESIGDLSNLQELSLDGLSLKYLPKSLEKLTKLTSLYVEGNRLTKLYDFVVRMPALRELYFDEDALPKKETKEILALMSRRRLIHTYQTT